MHPQGDRWVRVATRNAPPVADRKPRREGCRNARPVGGPQASGGAGPRGRLMDPVHEPLPVPPPFMWACDDCTELLRALAKTITADAGCLYEQLAVAQHITQEHPDAVPVPHTHRCDQCPRYAERADKETPSGSWAEHLARDLFLPEAVARLL